MLWAEGEEKRNLLKNMFSSIRHQELASQLSKEDKDKNESEEHFNKSLMRETLDLAVSCISLPRY